MKTEDLRRLHQKRPFCPFEIELTSGTRLAVRHPENLTLASEMGAAVTGGGKDLTFFSIEEVCAVHLAGNGRKKQARKS